MTTTNEMVARELAPREQDDRTSIHIFHSHNTLEEVFIAAKAIEKLGHVPELRFLLSRNEPAEIELYVKDVPSLIGKLRASLEATNGRRP